MKKETKIMKKETDINKISFCTSDKFSDKLSGIKIPDNSSKYTFHFFIKSDSTKTNISEEIIEIIENLGLVFLSDGVFIIPKENPQIITNFKSFFLNKPSVEDIDEKNNFVSQLINIGFKHKKEYEYFNDTEKYKPTKNISNFTNNINNKYSFYVEDDIFCFYLTGNDPSEDIDIPTNVIDLIESTGIEEGGESCFYPNDNFNANKKTNVIEKLKKLGFIHNKELDFN